MRIDREAFELSDEYAEFREAEGDDTRSWDEYDDAFHDWRQGLADDFIEQRRDEIRSE